MKKIILKLLFSIFIFANVSFNIYAQFPPDNNNYQLVFEDEFDSLGVDTVDNWKRDDWHMYYLSYFFNGCQQFIDKRAPSSDNLLFDTTGSGKVTLQARRENPPINAYVYDGCNNVSIWHDFHYSSPAWFESKEKYKYGYYEIRCRIPQIDTAIQSIKGIGPNFWLYSSYPTWSEIDGFEYFSLVHPTPLWGSAVHYQECPPPGNGTCDTLYYGDSPDNLFSNNTGTYHNYAIKWDPEKIEFYFDNQLKETSYNHPSELDPQAIIIDMNIFYNPNNWPNDSTLFPFNYDVDYVRIYQMKQSCTTDTSFCSFNPSTFNFALYKTITFGDGSCSLTIDSDEPLNFISTDGFTLNPLVEVTAGTEFTLGIDLCQPNDENRSDDNSLPVMQKSDYYKNH
ncbi:MAG: family 16 glycosylhydrolase [Bacteroidales bacterium]|nr:family 16 glycosylhydrolase [Bacteroidales bacterium]